MDDELRKRVIEKLRSHTEYNTKRVRVKTENGVVELSGHVDGEIAQSSLEGLARTVDGVSDVINHLQITVASTSGVQGLRIE